MMVSEKSVLARTIPVGAVILCSRKSIKPLFTRKSILISEIKPTFQGKHVGFPSLSSPGSKSLFLILVLPLVARLLQSLFLFFFHKNSRYLYSHLKTAAYAVLKLISALMAITHVLSVSIKSLSISIMLLEYSLGKLKYNSTTLPLPGFSGPSTVSASNSHVFSHCSVF